MNGPLVVFEQKDLQGFFFFPSLHYHEAKGVKIFNFLFNQDGIL